MRAIPRFLTSGTVALFLAGAVAAQGKPSAKPSPEVGTMAGVTIVSQSGFSTTTHFGIPGGIGPVSTFSPMLYATFFASPSVMVEPQVAFSTTSGGGESATFFTFIGQIGYLFNPNASGSAYVAANGAFETANAGAGTVSGPGFGAALGYRFKVKSSLAMRLDGRYRRWFSDFKDVNEIGFSLGLGALF